jgi:hypothetical protein
VRTQFLGPLPAMGIALLQTEHGLNLAIFGLSLSFVLLVSAIRLSRQGGDGLSGIAAFGCFKLAEGFFLAVALAALLAILDTAVAVRLMARAGYAIVALIGGAVTAIDLLLDD